LIDTIKLSIYREFNRKIYDTLLHNSFAKTAGFLVNSTTGMMEKTDMFRYKQNVYDTYEMMIINGKINLPSWNYDIFYRCFEDRIDLELSLPKFIYGTNVIQLLNHISKELNPYKMLVLSVKKFFETFFFNHPIDYGGVKLQRWDLCFNQSFTTYDESIKALNYIKLKHQKKTDVKNYEFGYIELSKNNYLKIYHKGEEFKKHDFYKMDKKRVEQIGNIAMSILRYERKITPKSIAYYYNTKVKFASQPLLVDLYLKAKRENRISKQLRSDFENVQQFTLGSPKILGCVKLNEIFFNSIYTNFMMEIKKKFSINGSSIDRLKHEVFRQDNKQNKTMKIRILAMIKTFKSLNRALENKAISPATYYRYVAFMEKNNLSTTNIKLEIFQDFSYQNYFRQLNKNSLIVQNMTKDINF